MSSCATISPDILRIDAGREKKRGCLQNLHLQFRRRLIDSNGVQIDDSEDALIVVLYANPALQRSEIVADVQISGGLNA